jgi:RNA polymerase sigma-70 factor (ECF subfamily)
LKDPTTSGNDALSETSGAPRRGSAHDPEVWDRLVRLYAPLVCLWCRRVGVAAEAAEEAGQEVFRAVWDRADEFRRARASGAFRLWLRAIAGQRLRNRGGSGAVDPSSIAGPDAKADEAEVKLLARRAAELVRGAFAEQTWQAFHGTAFEGRRAGDVAAELGVPVRDVHLARSRVLHRIREDFGGLADADLF